MAKRKSDMLKTNLRMILPMNAKRYIIEDVLKLSIDDDDYVLDRSGNKVRSATNKLVTLKNYYCTYNKGSRIIHITKDKEDIKIMNRDYLRN